LAFVSDHRLDRSGQAAYYRSRFKGGKWFPLVYGNYATAAEARRAIAGLPEKIRSMSPWIRKMSAVHAEIRKAATP
jgi:DamX protein